MTTPTSAADEITGAALMSELVHHALSHMSRQVATVNEANGWFEDDRTVGDDLALLHSEVSEALEAYRDHGLDDVTGTERVEVRQLGEAEPRYLRGADTAHHHPSCPARDVPSASCVGCPPAKPEGFGSELADVLIRLLDTAHRRGINLAAEYERKLAYNATRERRHGGKRL